MRTLTATATASASASIPASAPAGASVDHVAALPATLVETRIAVLFEDGSCLLGNGTRAVRAVSCLVEPQAGDRVLASAGEGGAHVLHILARTDGDDARLSVHGATGLSLRQGRIALHAAESLELASGVDASVSAVSGTLSLAGRNLFSTFADTIVEQASHRIGKVGQFLLEARQLLRLHGEHALITAERDVKVDAERISVG